MEKKTCPECGSHGNRGRVCLLESWVDCLTCAAPKPAEQWKPTEELVTLKGFAADEFVTVDLPPHAAIVNWIDQVAQVVRQVSSSPLPTRAVKIRGTFTV